MKIDTHKPVDRSHRGTHLYEPLVDGFRFPILDSAKYPPGQSQVPIKPSVPQPTSVTFRADLNGFGGLKAASESVLVAEDAIGFRIETLQSGSTAIVSLLVRDDSKS